MVNFHYFTMVFCCGAGEIRTPIVKRRGFYRPLISPAYHRPHHAEGKGIEPLSRMIARCSKPVKHHCLLPSKICMRERIRTFITGFGDQHVTITSLSQKTP